jgi:exosortase A
MEKNSALSVRQAGLAHYLLWLVFGGAFLAAFLPNLTGLIHSWANSEDYSHGFAIVPLSLYTLWLKRDTLLKEQVRGSWTGLLVITGVLLLYVIAEKGEMLTIASISMILFLWGAVIFLLGYAIFRACLFSLLILFFMIPVPGQIIASLTIPLQLIVTKASVGLASLIGIPIYHEGNVIQLPQGTFQVVQACSGLRSIMTMLTLGAVLAYFTLRSNILRGILFILAVPIAILVNILRVFVLIAVFHYLAIDLSEGSIHTILGLAVFVIAIGLFLLAGKGLALCER